MKNYLISALLIVGFASIGLAVDPVDRTEKSILATSASNGVAGTVIVSQSPTNEYALGVYSVICATNGSTATTFVPPYTVAPIQISLSAGQVSNTVSAITVATFTVTNTAPYITTNTFMFHGVKRIGKKQ